MRKHERTRILLLVGAAAGLGACAPMTPTQPAPTTGEVDQIEARLTRVERKVDNQSLIEMSNQLSGLETEMRTLRGEIEALQFKLEQASKRQRELYLDTDGRLVALESGGRVRRPSPGGSGAEGGSAGAPPAVVAAPVGGSAPSGNEQDAYQAAFDSLKNGRYEQAATGFGQFLETYPQSNLADNAQYWLAETHYVTRDFPGALAAFQKVIDDYPASRKRPDALLKIGYCNYEAQNWPAAREALKQVTADYPDTTAAKLANQRLARMDSEGR